MWKIVPFILLIAGQVRGYFFQVSPYSDFDILGNCDKMFPKDHVIQRGCHSAHAVCQRHNLQPVFIDGLVFNNLIYDYIGMQLPSGVSIPYFIYEADPFLFHGLYDKIIIETKPPVSLHMYREIIRDPDFRIAKALHHTYDPIMLQEMIEVMLDHLYEDDVTAVVGNWFQGDFKIIAPLISDYLPELEDVTIVKIAANYPKLELVKKVMHARNITLAKVNPYHLNPIKMNNGQEITVVKIRQILDFFKEPNNATVFPGMDFMSDVPRPDTALPIWQWLKVHDEIHLENYPYIYREMFPVVRFLAGDKITALTDPENSSKIKSQGRYQINDDSPEPEFKLAEPGNPLSLSSVATPSDTLEDTENLNVEQTTLQYPPKVTDPEMALISQGTTTDDNPEDAEKLASQSSSGSTKNLEDEEMKTNRSSEDEPMKEEEKPSNLERARNSEYSDNCNDSEDSGKSGKIPLQRRPLHTPGFAGNETNHTQKPSIPHLEKLHPPNSLNLSTALSLFSEHQNGTIKYPNRIFTTCALYYLKVNGTQDRVVFSEAGILSFPLRRICDELLRLDMYNGSHTEHVGLKGSANKSESAHRDVSPRRGESAPEGSSRISHQTPSHKVEPAADSSESVPPAPSTDDSSSITRQAPSSASHDVEPTAGSTKSVPLAPFVGIEHIPTTPDHAGTRPSGYGIWNWPRRRSAAYGSANDFPVSPFDDMEEEDSLDRIFRKTGLHHKPPLRHSPLKHHRFNLPPHLRKTENSFLEDEIASEQRPLNPRRSRRLPRASMRSFDASSELDQDTWIGGFDDRPLRGVRNHFRRSMDPIYYEELRRRSMEERLKSLDEEIEDLETRQRYFGSLKDMRTYAGSRQQPEAHEFSEYE